MNWGKVARHALWLFAMQFVIGFVEGLLTPEVSSSAPALVVSVVGASLVLFVACAAVFAHLSAHQQLRPYAHAWLVLLFQACAGSLLWLMIPDWLRGSDPVGLVALEWVVLVCALLAGTEVGRHLQRRAQSA